MSELPVSVGSFWFPSQKVYILACQEVLHRDELNTEIVGEDRLFVEAIFNAREDKLAEVGDQKVIRFLRKMHRHNTPCFFAELDNGTLIDFSFMKLVRSPASQAA